jgi:hypothetical protein
MIVNPHEMSWLAVEAYARKEIERHRDRLETDGLMDTESQFLRGKIAALRDVIRLADQQSSDTHIPTVDYMRT